MNCFFNAKNFELRTQIVPEPPVVEGKGAKKAADSKLGANARGGKNATPISPKAGAKGGRGVMFPVLTQESEAENKNLLIVKGPVEL